MHFRILIAGLFLSGVFCGCNTEDWGAREKGAAAGGAVGAGLGAIVGSQTGSTVEGVAIGTAVGVLAGGLVGNEMDRRSSEIGTRGQTLANQEQRIAENQQMIEELKRRGTDVRLSDRGVVVSLPDVLFKYNSALLSASAGAVVRDVAVVVQSYPDRDVAVEGHTDATGTIAYDQQLSEDRARAVADELVAQGVSRGRISSIGWGESRPIASNSTESGRAQNRRVEVIIVSN